MAIRCDGRILLERIWVSEKEYITNNLIDFDNNMYLAVDSLIDINNLVIGSNNITLRKVIVKLYGYDKMYMDNDLIEYKLFQLIDQFNERSINHKDFYSVPLNNIYTFYDTCKILFYSQSCDFSRKMLVDLTHFSSLSQRNKYSRKIRTISTFLV